MFGLVLTWSIIQSDQLGKISGEDDKIHRTSFCNTPGTWVGQGGRDQTLVIKSRQNTRKSVIFLKAPYGQKNEFYFLIRMNYAKEFYSDL